MANNRTTYVTKKGKMTLTCEWADCEKDFSEMDEFMSHITEHIHSFVPKVIQPIDENTCVDDFVCEWRDCNYEMTGGFLELMRHVYFHGFHIKLKSIGLAMTIKKSLRGCTMDTGSRNVIPDLPERFHCGWKHCDCISDNAEYFYQHVRQHADDYPQGKDLQVPAKCMWEGCEASFSSKYKLMEHLRSHTQEKTVACPACGSLFSSTTKFTDHLRRQDDLEVQSFQCSHCSKRFSSERLLRDHMRKHVNNFKCPFCEMTTPSPSTLRQHIRYRHSDERDFQCPHCDASFKMSRDLERHIKIIHEKNEIFYCDHDDCSYKTHYEFQITEHMRNKHNLKDPKYVCQVCQSRFCKGRTLTRHLKKAHSFKWPPGHRRFRYKLGQDGNFHLQTVRYESYELSQQLQSDRQRKALSGISVDGVRGGQKKCHRQVKGQTLTLDSMSTPATLAVRGQDSQGEGQATATGQGHPNITNIENEEAVSTGTGSNTVNKKRKTQANSKQRKRKRTTSRHSESENTGESSRKKSRKKQQSASKPAKQDIETSIETAEKVMKNGENVATNNSGDEDNIDSVVPETLQIITEDGEVLLIQTNLPTEKTSPKHHVGIVTAEKTQQGVLLSIKPQDEGESSSSEVSMEQREVGVIYEKREPDFETTGPSDKGVNSRNIGNLEKNKKKSSKKDEVQNEDMDSEMEEEVEEGLVINENEGGVTSKNYNNETIEERLRYEQAGEETGNISHGLFYAVMNTAIQHNSSELILKSNEEPSGQAVEPTEGVEPRFGEGGVMYDVQVPLGSDNVTIDLPTLAKLGMVGGQR